jgi:OmpA-OmpF porin, OOP family
MATLLDNLRDLATPAIVSALSRATGESEPSISKGFGAAIPAIASTIANRSDDHGFLKNLMALATSSSETDPLEAISKLAFSGPGIDTTTKTGAWLSNLFGGNLSAVTDSIASFAGVRNSSAASLLSIGAPLVLNYLGRLVRSDNLDLASLGSLLQGRRAEFASALPAGFKIPAFTAPFETHRPRLSRTDWSIPAMALLAAIGLGGLFWWFGHRPADMARVEEPAMKTVGTSGVLAGRFARTLPGNVTIVIPGAGSAEDRLSSHLASAQARVTVKFDRIGFESNSATLTPKSNEQIDNIALILRAYPDAKVTIAGFTDNTGNEGANLSLSRARAMAVAERLKADGVTTERVRAMGYGSGKPIADNSTEAGRTQNRRIEMEVVR